MEVTHICINSKYDPFANLAWNICSCCSTKMTAMEWRLWMEYSCFVPHDVV